jgi:hypothetical protein
MQRTVSEAGLGAQLLADGENESFLNVFGKLSLLRWSKLLSRFVYFKAGKYPLLQIEEAEESQCSERNQLPTAYFDQETET